jgi:hypothetical protein
MGCEDSSDSEPAFADRRDGFFTGDTSGVTKSPGDDCRDRTVGDADARGLAIFVRCVIGLRVFARTGIASSSSLLSVVAMTGASCCAFCGAAECDIDEFLLAASRFFMSSYASSPSLSSSSLVCSMTGSGRVTVDGFAVVVGIASSSDVDASFSDSASLSDESTTGLRRAASSFGRGFADASVARADEVCADAMAGSDNSVLNLYRYEL